MRAAAETGCIFSLRDATTHSIIAGERGFVLDTFRNFEINFDLTIYCDYSVYSQQDRQRPSTHSKKCYLISVFFSKTQILVSLLKYFCFITAVNKNFDLHVLNFFSSCSRLTALIIFFSWQDVSLFNRWIITLLLISFFIVTVSSNEYCPWMLHYFSATYYSVDYHSLDIRQCLISSRVV